ncbi:MAG: nucleoside-triphosphatase [Anaerolineales bacterium]
MPSQSIEIASKGKIVLLSGERHIGKSTLCLCLEHKLHEAELEVSGIITQRVGPHELEVKELRTQACYALTARRQAAIQNNLTLPHFQMDPNAMARSMAAIADSFPTKIFILDELGPLELRRQQGWHRALYLLKRARYQLAFIVVRPELLVAAMWQLPQVSYTVITVTEENRDHLPASLQKLAVEACKPPIPFD